MQPLYCQSLQKLCIESIINSGILITNADSGINQVFLSWKNKNTGNLLPIRPPKKKTEKHKYEICRKTTTIRGNPDGVQVPQTAMTK